jgi:NTE family protein
MAVSELIDTPLLEGLDPDQRRRLATLFTRRDYQAGTVVIRQGERSDSLFIVESGSLLVHSLEQGHVARLGPGECLGEITLFVDASASAFVTTETDSVLLVAPYDGLRGFLEEAPVLACNFSRVLSRRLAQASHRTHRSRVSVLVSTAEGVGIGFALNMAASLGHHLQQPAALLDLSSKAGSADAEAEVTFEQPLERLTIVRARGRLPDQLLSLVEALGQRHGHVLVWAPPEIVEQPSAIAALMSVADRVVLAVPYEACGRTDYRPWTSPKSTTDLLVLGAPKPRSRATAEAITPVPDVKLALLLPDTPHALRREPVAPDWVLRHPNTAFARAVGQVARRLLRKSVGIAFGGGGGRGHAHMGVIRALIRAGVRADFVSGTSIGACVAGLYAHGVPPHEMEVMIKRLATCIRRWSFPVFSLLAGAGLDWALRDSVGPHLRIEDFPIPCAFVAVDLVTGEEMLLTRGCAWAAARASVTIPGIFPAARVDGRLLVDGGLTSPVPCRAVRNLGADVVIGISLETPSPPPGGTWKLAYGRRGPTWPAALLRAFNLQQHSLTLQCLDEADVPIRTFSPSVGLTDFRGGPEFVEAGERAVEVALNRLHDLLPWVG